MTEQPCMADVNNPCATPVPIDSPLALLLLGVAIVAFVRWWRK